LINLVSMTPIGRISHMVLWREKQRRNVEITIADRDAILARGAPAPPEADPRSPASTRPARPLTPDGVDAVTISNEAQAKRHDLPSDARGVLVLRVAPSSPLNDWLRPKDIVESFTGARGAPRSLAEIENAVRQALSNPAFELQIRRLEPQGYVPASVRLRE
jgi:hypothetical protein